MGVLHSYIHFNIIHGEINTDGMILLFVIEIGIVW